MVALDGQRVTGGFPGAQTELLDLTGRLVRGTTVFHGAGQTMNVEDLAFGKELRRNHGFYRHVVRQVSMFR